MEASLVDGQVDGGTIFILVLGHKINFINNVINVNIYDG